MPELLVVAPSRGSCAEVCAALVPRLASKFTTVGIVGPQVPEMTTFPADTTIPVVLSGHQWTHIVVMGTLAELTEFTRHGLQATETSAICYGYAFVETPFIDHNAAALAPKFDFFVTTSNMAAAAYRGVLLDFRGKVSKSVFKGAYETKVIKPGTNTKTFVPLDPYQRQFSRTELREAFFGDVGSNDFVIVTAARDPAVTLAIVKQLQTRMAPRRVVAVVTREIPNLEVLCGGTELEFGTDVRVLAAGAPERRNLIYNMADVFLCTDTQTGWPQDVLEAQSAGCVVAAPDDHTWLELIESKRGIELPAGLFEFRGPVPERRVLPDAAAERIVAAFSSELHREIRETCILAAHHKNSAFTWNRCASEWLALMGLQ